MNVFFEKDPSLGMEDYLNYNEDGRSNLGEELPVMVYRMLEFSLKEELTQQFGKEQQIRIFRNAGFRAGEYFAGKFLDLKQGFAAFAAQFQAQAEKLKMGIVRFENMDEETGRIILTVAEDADCSGLPLLGETVCNYDEGFIAGILSAYTGKKYTAKEIDCWATGDRVCRFQAEVRE